jgi:hypothetical protein
MHMQNFYDFISISHWQLSALYYVLRLSDLANSVVTCRRIWNRQNYMTVIW